MEQLNADTATQNGRLMVKNTFLDLVGGDGEEEPREKGEKCRTRSSSDPGLYEGTFHGDVRQAMGEQEVIVMSGLSDAETEEDVLPPASQLPVLAEIAPNSPRTSSTENPADGVQAALDCAPPSWDPIPVRFNHFPEEIPANTGSTASASSHPNAWASGLELQQQMDNLAQQNARLLEMNRQLMESYRHVNGAAASGTAAAYCAPPQMNLSAYPPMGAEMGQTWLGNSAGHAGMRQPMVCIAMPQLARQHVSQMSQPIEHATRKQIWNPRQQRAKQDPQKQQPQLGQHSMPQDLGAQHKFARSSAEESVEGPEAESASNDDSPRTTVMLRNLPNNYSRRMLIDMIDAEGFRGQYDFVYLPMDFNTQACLGYAFVNMLHAEAAQRFWTSFNGYSRWAIPSRKLCCVSWSNPHQGLQSNLDRYRNSPVMHEAVPEEYKPMLFVDGMPAQFPAPTKKIRAPRPKKLVNR